MRSLFAKLAALTLVVISSHAHAVTFNFSLTGNVTANWQLDSNPRPDASTVDFFMVANVPGTYGGVDGTRDLSFYTNNFGGGLFFVLDPVANLAVNLLGSEVFSGPGTDPTFSLGTFALTSASLGQFSLSISEAATAVPEPATWVTMMVGFGFVGGAVRHRRRSLRGRRASTSA